MGDRIEEGDSRPRRARKSRGAALRSLPALVATLSVLGLFYPLAMNVFLSTRLFVMAIDGDPSIDIHFRRGWSIFPGHIHAKDLSIRGRDGNVEWMLRLDDVEFDVSFQALAHQRFEASHVHGRGISFRLRQRLDAPPGSPDEIANLPPIEGLGPYALRPPPHPEPELWSDAAYHLWTAHLEDIIAEDVREVWIDNAHFEGNARIAGRFYLKPIRRVDVGAIRIDVREGHVLEGTSLVVERLSGAAAEVTVIPFDPRTVGGMDLFRHISLEARLQPTCPDVGRLHFPTPEGIHVAGDLDVRRFVLDLRDGTLQVGTTLDATWPQAVVTGAAYRFAGTLALAGGVTLVEGRGRLDVRARLTDLDVSRARGPSAPAKVLLHLPQAIVLGDSRALDLADPFADAHLLLDLAGAELPDVRALSAYIPLETPLALKGGKGRLSAHLEMWRPARRATGVANLAVDDLTLRLGEMRIRGRATADAAFRSLLWESARLEQATLSLHIANGVLASDETGVPLVHVGNLRIDASAAEVALADPLRTLHAAVSVDDGEVVDPDLLRAYLPKGSEMHILPARAHLSLAGELTLTNHLARGTLGLLSPRLGLSFRDFHFAVDVRANARVHDWHWERGDLVLDQADVALTDVSAYRSDRDPREQRAAKVDDSPSAPAAPALSLSRISLEARSQRFTLVDPLAQVDLSASLADARVHDSAIVNAFLPAGAPFLIVASGGSFSSDVQAAIKGHRILEGTIALRAVNMQIGGASLHLGGDADLLAHVTDWDLPTSTLRVEDAHVLFSHVTGGFHGVGSDLSLAAASPGYTFGKPDVLAEHIELWASTPALDLVRPSRHNLDARVVVVGAELPDATVLQPFMPASQILAIDFGRARVAADLEISSTKRTARGRLDMELPHTGIRFNETHLAGNFKLAAQLLKYDPQHNVFDVSGSHFAMSDVKVTNASTSIVQWQGDAVFDEATFRLDPRPELDGRVAVEARDAGPILAILLGNGLPKFFAGLTQMPHLSATARLTMGTHHVALRDLAGHGGDLSIEGIYVVGRDRRVGAFVVGKGPFSAGFRLDDDGAHLRLFGLQGWLRDETRASLRLLEEPRPTPVTRP